MGFVILWEILRRFLMDYIYDYYDEDRDEAYKDQEENISTECDCSNCMQCLDMSWRDFF